MDNKKIYIALYRDYNSNEDYGTPYHYNIIKEQFHPFTDDEILDLENRYPGILLEEGTTYEGYKLMSTHVLEIKYILEELNHTQLSLDDIRPSLENYEYIVKEDLIQGGNTRLGFDLLEFINEFKQVNEIQKLSKPKTSLEVDEVIMKLLQEGKTHSTSMTSF